MSLRERLRNLPSTAAQLTSSLATVTDVMRSLPVRRLAVTLVALGLVAGACSSTESGNTADTVAQPEQTSGPTSSDDSSTAQVDTQPETITEPGSSEGPAPSTSAAEPVAVPAAVPAALQFTAPLVGGGEFDGATVADKPTVFWFWAPT